MHRVDDAQSPYVLTIDCVSNLIRRVRATGDLRRLRPMPVTQFHRRPKNVTFGSARPIEHEISNIEETTAYEDRPLVPPNARELYENGTSFRNLSFAAFNFQFICLPAWVV